MPVRLTFPDKKFAEEIANNINKNFPNQAFVVNKCCLVTKDYWSFCTEYVLKNCKIKDYEISNKR